MGNSNITSSVKKTEKLTLKPFDIKKGGVMKISSKPVFDNGMKGYLNPYNGGGDGNDDEITDSFNGGGMGNNFDRNQSSALGGQPSQSSLAPL
jgi:hypothetical protein